MQPPLSAVTSSLSGIIHKPPYLVVTALRWIAHFNNDSNACAPFNAATFVRSLRALGLTANPGWEAVRRQA
jgi:hypothetical protein